MQMQSSQVVMARQQQMEVNEQRRQTLLPVAVALRDPVLAPVIIGEAFEQVKKWRDRKLCSADYISAWESLLLVPSKAANVLEECSPDAVQLRQNSPFVSAVRRFKQMAHAA